MRKVVFLLLNFILGSVFAQNLPPKLAYPINVKQIHSGHSLTDPLFNNWPGQYPELIKRQGGSSANVAKSTLPGSNLVWRWNNPTPVDAKLNIANFELLCITERVALAYEGGNTAGWYINQIQDQKNYLSLFVNNAWNNGNNGNGAPTLLWTTWVHTDNSSGDFRQMLDIQGAEWERMQDYANANKPTAAPPVYIIPGHKMMARIYDDIQLNLVPGITNITQLFSDTIHPNSLGQYAVTMMHYACVFNTSPVGLPVDLMLSNNTNPRPSAALANYLQTIIWEVVTSYRRTGIYKVALDVTENSTESNNYTIYPNPTTNIIFIKHKHSNTYSEKLLLDASGKVVYRGTDNQINMSSLSTGTYILKIGNYNTKIIKQ